MIWVRIWNEQMGRSYSSICKVARDEIKKKKQKIFILINFRKFSFLSGNFFFFFWKKLNNNKKPFRKSKPSFLLSFMLTTIPLFLYPFFVPLQQCIALSLPQFLWNNSTFSNQLENRHSFHLSSFTCSDQKPLVSFCMIFFSETPLKKLFSV